MTDAKPARSAEPIPHLNRAALLEASETTGTKDAEKKIVRIGEETSTRDTRSKGLVVMAGMRRTPTSLVAVHLAPHSAAKPPLTP